MRAGDRPDSERLDDAAAQALRGLWNIPADVTYLNHGAFGASPRPVRERRREWLERVEAQPADFFERHLEAELDRVTDRLGQFVGCDGGDLILCDNATVAMNVVAASVPLSAGDEVLVTSHEYGAVVRLWTQACQRANARLVACNLSYPLATADDVVAQLLACVTSRTRLVVVSHVSSPTAVVFPVEQICAALRPLGVPVCVDGPHALAMRPLDLGRLDADFYTVSCHKWLAGPFGTGFLYAHPRVQASVRPVLTSWGMPPAGARGTWRDEFIWQGTRDVTGYLALPAAIDFLEEQGLAEFRRRTHELAAFARGRLEDSFGGAAPVPDDLAWYGSMIAVELPPGEGRPLHQALWERFKIEVPIVEWRGRRFVRVSCYLYTTTADIERLIVGLTACL